mmetsp:Transcript_70555/g.196314  ORF Transcript_70555/g.196314 Transcript_70555/m.196314 type:complete len:122 (+) Transcript_70555:1017-1382(+)
MSGSLPESVVISEADLAQPSVPTHERSATGAESKHRPTWAQRTERYCEPVTPQRLLQAAHSPTLQEHAVPSQDRVVAGDDELQPVDIMQLTMRSCTPAPQAAEHPVHVDLHQSQPTELTHV